MPFREDSFDSALAVLTVHHWADAARGFAEMRRVSRRRIVVLTWDPEVWDSFWLIRDYFPLRDVDRRRAVPISEIVAALGESRVIPVPIPHDCVDGFHGAFWGRPKAYLDPRVRAGISGFAGMDPGTLDEGLRRLAADIESGGWDERYGSLCNVDELDLGYRLVVA